MPTSNAKSHDELISHLIAALHTSQSLHMDMIEKLIRMSLIELGQSIANEKTQTPRKKRAPPPRTPANVMRALALVADPEPDMPTPRRSDPAVWRKRPDVTPVPRRRLPPRRTGSRG